MSTNLYTALDKQGKEAADEWFSRMGPQLEEAAREWMQEHPDVDEETYMRLVHPVLLWRFYYHASAIFLKAAEGWATVYRDNVKED